MGKRLTRVIYVSGVIYRIGGDINYLPRYRLGRYWENGIDASMGKGPRSTRITSITHKSINYLKVPMESKNAHPRSC